LDDFESAASASSAIPAHHNSNSANVIRLTSMIHSACR
jgi:hypothetical protein